MGRDCQAGSRQTGVPQGRDSPRQHLDTPLLAPSSIYANRCFAWAQGQARGPCQGAWPRPPPRAACSPGECAKPGRGVLPQPELLSARLRCQQLPQWRQLRRQRAGGKRPWLLRGPGWGSREGPGGALVLAPPGAGW